MKIQIQSLSKNLYVSDRKLKSTPNERLLCINYTVKL